MNKKRWWKISNTISISCLVAIVVMWYHTTQKYEPNENQLTNQAKVDEYLTKTFPQMTQNRIPTGVYLQSLRFNNASEVNISGYIWQKYNQATYQGVPNDKIPVGFILPEEVDSGSNIEPKLTYRKKIPGNQEVIGWYFESTLKQTFYYSKYPFDHKTVWIRLWSADFEGGTALVPDFSSYTSTKSGESFGYDKEIVLGNWKLIETFFDFSKKQNDSNFGLFPKKTNTTEPELNFNVVLERKFINSFIVYIVPLMIISCLAFATLMMITSDKDLASLFGVNTSGVIGVCSGLFFIVLLSQIQIREQFAGSKIVYVEYCYPLIYGALLGISVNSYLFSQKFKGQNRFIKYIEYEDNIIPKLIFWPGLLGSATIITALVLLPKHQQQGMAINQSIAPHLTHSIPVAPFFSSTKLQLMKPSPSDQSTYLTLLPLSSSVQRPSFSTKA